MAFIEDPRIYPSHFFDAGNGADPIDEILELAQEILCVKKIDLLQEIHYDIVDLFTGHNQSFKPNTMPYHTLRHTMMVALATMRFLHGLHCDKKEISRKTLLQGMLCAYFHDAGMLIKVDDPTTNPSEYIPFHEQRSALFLREYVAQKGLDASLAENTDIIIAYTWLNQEPTDLPPHSPREQMLGQLLGAADLLAQMGDRYYLESLPLLFSEQKRGDINNHEDVQALMNQTVFFFHDVVLKRFTTTCHDIFNAMQTHFRVRNNVDRNLYMEGIEKNLNYLKEILRKCENIECILEHLKRKPPKI